MLLKMGVDMSRLDNSIRKILTKVDTVFINATGLEAVISSTYDGIHMPSSFHYQNKAIDFRLPTIKIDEIMHRLRIEIGTSYDVVLEVTHIHIEFDPN